MAKGAILFETIFKRKWDAEDTPDFLRDVAEKHPYFTLAHFFLAKKTGNEYAAFEKSALQFNNSFWLNYKLMEDFVATPIVEEVILPKTNESFVSLEIEETTEIEKAPITIAEKEEKDIEASPKEEEEKQVEEVFQEDAPLPTISLPDLSAPVTEDTLHFEPLHTTDYFASQGIKLSEAIKSDDKLGKSLKSFTEWLKTMKKVHPENFEAPAAQSEAAIQQLAEKSNTDNEVITEAMADVLLQQGKQQKAIEVYEKLSLLNPSKNAYFAAKIENLKAR